MTKLLLVTLDGTIRHWRRIRAPLSPEAWIGIQQSIIPGALESLQAYHADGFTIFGITNQGGVAKGNQSIQDCVLEQRATIELTDGCLDLILFCPGDGRTAHVVDLEGTSMLKIQHSSATARQAAIGFRMPCAGMARYAIMATDASQGVCALVGHLPEHEAAAFHAGCEFMNAACFRSAGFRLVWRKPFAPNGIAVDDRELP